MIFKPSHELGIKARLSVIDDFFRKYGWAFLIVGNIVVAMMVATVYPNLQQKVLPAALTSETVAPSASGTVSPSPLPSPTPTRTPLAPTPTPTLTPTPESLRNLIPQVTTTKVAPKPLPIPIVTPTVLSPVEHLVECPQLVCDCLGEAISMKKLCSCLVTC